MARYISFAVLLAIIAVIGVLFYKVMIGFFVPVFLAAVLVVVFRPLHRWVCSKVGEREHIAAGATTALIVLIVLIPTALVLTMAAVQGASLYRNLDSSSIKFGLAKLRSNSLFKLDFPIAKQVQEIQKKVSDIQVQVAKQQTFQDLVSDKGLLRSDIKEIRDLLTQLVPRLVESSRTDLSDSIIQIRDKSNPKVQHTSQFDNQLLEFFEQTNEDVKTLVSTQSSISETDFRSEKERVKLKIDFPLGDLSPLERTMAINARHALIESGVAWTNEISAMDKLLTECLPNDETTMSQLQRAVADLVSQWMRTRETIAGGPWRAALMDLANPTDEDIEAMNTGFFAYIRPRLMTFTGDSAAFLLKFVISSSILLVSLYFFLYDGPSMVRTLMELSPLDDRYELELLAQFDRISRAIVLATVLSALLQGLVAGIGYYFAGMPSLILLTALTATCALVPFVGPAIVWVPVCLYLAVYEEKMVAAGLLAVWGMLVVGTVDNLVKVFVLHGQSQLHPLLALLSVLGGIQSLGPIGILVGPMVVVLLQTLLGILRTELTQFKKADDERTGADPKSTETKSFSGLIRKVKGSVIKEESASNDEEPVAEGPSTSSMS
jgi:predicted PurR-regulated permease PerM